MIEQKFSAIITCIDCGKKREVGWNQKTIVKRCRDCQYLHTRELNIRYKKNAKEKKRKA